MNVAVGGDMFPDWCINWPRPGDAAVEKPWRNNDAVQMRSFWLQRDDWLPTWNNLREMDEEDVSSAMQVDFIRVYSIDD